MGALEQLFYGRGPQGYVVLGLTPGAEAFRTDVEALCETIGTPVEASFEPFLVSCPCRGSVLMMRVCRGAPDSCGRETVFCHALIGAANDLALACVDAFALDERGLFKGKLPQLIESLEISAEDRPADVPPVQFKVGFPAVIMSRKPVKDLIRALLGKDALNRVWATFAFHRMAGFDLCALDADVPYPADVACYDVNGKLLSNPTIARAAPSPSAPTVGKGRREGSAMLKISIIVNVILILLCTVVFLRNPAPESEADTSCQQRIQEFGSKNDRLVAENSQLQAVVKRLQNELAEKGKSPATITSREEVLRQLKSEFEEKYHGTRQGVMRSGQHNSEDRAAFNPYIRFVNEVILESSNK